MIVCSCNVVSDRDVRGVLSGGGDGCPRRLRDVYGCLGCSPKCGRCARTIHEMLREAQGAAAAALEPALDAEAATMAALAE
jgi:bacterioferritin-associated ferredoxin